MESTVNPKCFIDLNWVKRIADCGKQIQSYPSGSIKRDLLKMYDNVTDLNTKRDKAKVECRRLGRITAEYERRQKDLEVSMDQLEQYIIMALLIK
jgi:hypothetical protein